MKSIVYGMVFFVGLAGFSFGGNCGDDFCKRPSKPTVQLSPRSIVLKSKSNVARPSDPKNVKSNKQ